MAVDYTENQISKLIKNGKKENVDFRVVYFGNKREVKMIQTCSNKYQNKT